MSKKTILLIVEGTSDKKALKIHFTNFFSNDEIEVIVCNGDITSDDNNTTENIEKKVSEIVSNSIKKYGLTLNDIKNIIHIVDTDGVYIDDSLVIYDENLSKKHINKKDGKEKIHKYTEKHIKTCCTNNIIERNHRKSKNIDTLLNVKRLFKKIPYQIYYMSSNLEHVLFDKMNCTQEDKGKLSKRFSAKYSNDLQGFLDFMINSNFSKCEDYEDSWDFIKSKNNSLKRFSNLGICFKTFLK